MMGMYTVANHKANPTWQSFDGAL